MGIDPRSCVAENVAWVRRAMERVMGTSGYPFKQSWWEHDVSMVQRSDLEAMRRHVLHAIRSDGMPGERTRYMARLVCMASVLSDRIRERQVRDNRARAERFASERAAKAAGASADSRRLDWIERCGADFDAHRDRDGWWVRPMGEPWGGSKLRITRPTLREAIDAAMEAGG